MYKFGGIMNLALSMPILRLPVYSELAWPHLSKVCLYATKIINVIIYSSDSHTGSLLGKKGFAK